jgi:hypothetical protein
MGEIFPDSLTDFLEVIRIVDATIDHRIQSLQQQKQAAEKKAQKSGDRTELYELYASLRVAFEARSQMQSLRASAYISRPIQSLKLLLSGILKRVR